MLLVSLMNGFRDLTLMGVQAFDFNHLNNVLISADCRKARLIDIDGASKGSIQFPSRYIEGPADDGAAAGDDAAHHAHALHKPALDVDLATLLPLVVQQLVLGKGRGKPFVNEKVSLIKRARTEGEAKGIIGEVVRENFFQPHTKGAAEAAPPPLSAPQEKHLGKVTEWFYKVLMKRGPWATWTDDIYDAMRCIDHLPVA